MENANETKKGGRESTKIPNDFSDETKARIREYANGRIDEILGSELVTLNDISRVLFCSHTTVKPMFDANKTATEIVNERMSEKKKTSTKSIKVESLGELLANLPDDERDALKSAILKQISPDCLK